MRGRAGGIVLASVVLGAALSLYLRGLDAGPAGPAERAPSRVILFAPNLTETAFALGCGEKVVAVTDYCSWPPAALQLPRVGGALDPHLERIARLHPDLLVLQGRNERLRPFARRQGIPMVSLKMDDDLASILGGIVRLDSLLTAGTGRAAARCVGDIRDRLAEIERRVAGRSRPSTLIVIGHGPGTLSDLITVGRGSFLNELVEIAGGDPQYAEHPIAYFKLALETLLADPPQVALELHPGRTLDERAREEILVPWQRAGLTETRVEILSYDGLLVPGPRIAESAAHLLRALHPELEILRPGERP